jgi:hypothetical protein
MTLHINSEWQEFKADPVAGGSDMEGKVNGEVEKDEYAQCTLYYGMKIEH